MYNDLSISDILVVFLPVLDGPCIGESEECAGIHWVDGHAQNGGNQSLQEDEGSVGDEEGLYYDVTSRTPRCLPGSNVDVDELYFQYQVVELRGKGMSCD